MRRSKTGISIDIIREYCPFRANWGKLARTLSDTMRRCRCRKAHLSVRMLDSREISKLNRQYLGHRGATDVISFDLSDPGARVFDLAVNAQRAAQEGRRRGHGAEAELALYVLHGLLHCLGYDDRCPEEAKAMHALEDEILEEHGYGVIYSCK